MVTYGAKRCRDCLKFKVRASFHRSPKARDGLHSYCIGCNKARGAAWFQRNKARRQAAAKAWSANNPGRCAAYSARWAAANPEYGVLKSARRRAAKRGARHAAVTKAMLAGKLEAFKGLCAYCPAPFEHWDHVFPLARGGAHEIENLVPACARCNMSKGAKTLHEWGRDACLDTFSHLHFWVA